MPFLESMARLWSRFRYPVSMPEDLAHDLGLYLPNTLTVNELIKILSSEHASPRTLYAYMTRGMAEAVFQCAAKKECFLGSTFFSYDLKCGWLVIVLHFDVHGHLRRAHVQCPASEAIDGFELRLIDSACHRGIAV